MTAVPLQQHGALRPLAVELSRTCRVLHALGWLPATSGNLSVRVDDESLLITASGFDKGRLTAADVVLVDIHDPELRADAVGLRPSAETSIHAAVYRSTDAGAVIHTHSPHATAVASLAGSSNKTRQLLVQDFELVKALGHGAGPAQVPIFANDLVVAHIAEAVERHLAEQSAAVPVLMIERHGVTTWGADLDQARLRMEAVESLCQLMLLTGSLSP